MRTQERPHNFNSKTWLPHPLPLPRNSICTRQPPPTCQGQPAETPWRREPGTFPTSRAGPPQPRPPRWPPPPPTAAFDFHPPCRRRRSCPTGRRRGGRRWNTRGTSAPRGLESRLPAGVPPRLAGRDLWGHGGDTGGRGWHGCDGKRGGLREAAGGW